MKIKEVIYIYLTRVGMTSHQLIKRHPFNLLNSAMLLTFAISTLTNVMYLIYGATILTEYADCIYSLISNSTAAINFAFVTWKMAEIIRFIENLDDIINTRIINPTLNTIYKQTGEKIQKFAESANLGFVKVTPASTTIPIFIGSLLTYFTTDLGPDALELPYPIMWFPFGVKNPFGYSVAVAIQFTSTMNLCVSVVSVLVIVIAPCLILISTTEDIKCGLNALNTSARTNESDFKITQQFYQFVQFDSKTKQLANEFSQLVQFIFFVYFSWSIGSICLTMFGITIQLRDNAPELMIFQSIISLILSFSLVFVACEFGYKLSVAFNSIDYTFGQLHWYRFSLKLWKNIPILIAAIQEPVLLRVFGSTSCGRKDFQGVVNLGFSYFMVLQRFDS